MCLAPRNRRRIVEVEDIEHPKDVLSAEINVHIAADGRYRLNAQLRRAKGEYEREGIVYSRVSVNDYSLHALTLVVALGRGEAKGRRPTLRPYNWSYTHPRSFIASATRWTATMYAAVRMSVFSLMDTASTSLNTLVIFLSSRSWTNSSSQ